MENVQRHSDDLFLSTTNVYDRSFSIFLLARGLGLSADIAFLAQSIVGLCSISLMVLIWKGTSDAMYRAFAVAFAMALLTPKFHQYDAAILIVPTSLLIANVLRGRTDLSLLLIMSLIWLSPLLVPVFRVWGFNPVGLLLLAGLLVVFTKVRRTKTGFQQ